MHEQIAGMTARDTRKSKSELLSELRSLGWLIADMQETPASSDDDYRYRHLLRFLPDDVRITIDGIIVWRFVCLAPDCLMS